MLFIYRKTLALSALLLALTLQISAVQCHQKVADSCYTPVQISLCDPVQTSPNVCDVCGLRVNVIYGKNHNVTGVDLGLINHVTGDMKGLELGAINVVEGEMSGMQTGLFNCCSNLNGVQNGLINVCENKADGVQRGFINQARDVNGLQWGLINISRNLNGVQLGLINIQKSRYHFRVMPIINIAFTRMPKDKCPTCGGCHHR